MLAHNRKRPRRFIHAAGMRYAARLRAVAQQAGRITRDFSAEDPASAARIESRLRQYAESLHEWAANAAQAMLQDIERLEAKQWKARMREMARAILRSGDIAVGRAYLIARTETSRAAMALTQARAQHVGSDGYLWRTAGDADVRPSHRRMNGEFVKWDAPPELDKWIGHAGCVPKCRCTAEPAIPE